MADDAHASSSTYFVVALLFFRHRNAATQKKRHIVISRHPVRRAAWSLAFLASIVDTVGD